MSQSSSMDENIEICDDQEPLDNRGDADGSSLSSESNKVVDCVVEEKNPFVESKLIPEEISIENQEADSNNCSCKRTGIRPYEENGSVLLGAWNELRSSLRQLHRSVVPSSLNKSGLPNPRNRPSINRIKALSNMLLAHDPHQLFTRVNQLSQELCIELKVRLLATIHDSPDTEEALTFIKGLCDSYEWVINVCEAIQAAFEKLDTDHLSRFGLNWMTVNMHTFHATIFTDPDVQDYIAICCEKIEEKEEAKEVLGCLSSLRRTLSVSENVWAKAENKLQEYAMERAAINAQRRQLLTSWGQLKVRHSLYNKYNGQNYPLSMHSSMEKEAIETPSIKNSVAQENQSQQCPCTECHKSECKSHSPSPPSNSSENAKDLPKSCECHFCNSSLAQPQQPNSSVLPSSTVGVLPPLSQPQLSLYPHIHGTSSNGNIASNQGFDDLGPLPSASSSKPPIFSNPYLGSDLLTEQLIREWDLAYGDALTPPGIQPITSSNAVSLHEAELSNQLESLSINAEPPNSHSNCESHSCLHTQQPSSSLPCSISNKPTSAKSGTESNCIQESSRYKDQMQMLQKQEDGSSSIISHTKNCSNVHHPHGPGSRDGEVSLPSESDLSDPEDWSSGDESDDFSTSSSTNHKDAHCDCCYCHMMQNKPGGGRQRYSDRRERLLKILSHKKRSSGVSSTEHTSCTSLASMSVHEQHVGKDSNQIGRQTLDEIMNYIEGKRTNSKCHKKAAKKARQKERKLAMKRQEEKRNCENLSDDDDDLLDVDHDYGNELSENEEEEDGPLAELRRRAPDVTITVVKPGQKNPNQRMAKHQMGINRDMNTNLSNVKHPLAAKPITQPAPPSNSMWNPPRATLPSGRLSAMPMSPATNNLMGSKDNGLSPGNSSTGGLSSLLKGMESLSKDQAGDKDGKSSQMVTIRRVMDPISSEPTVTITLKGEEPKKDKVLFKLVNGQACPGNAPSSQVQQQPKKKKPQERPVYSIPEGTSPEEAKKMKKRQKKERQKQRKEQERMEEHQREQMKQLELQKRQEFLKQQEAHIRKQQAALERQQQELLRQQAKGSIVQNKKKGKKGKSLNEKQTKENNKNNNNNNTNKNKKKNKNVSALVYDGDDVARNFSLPPGVSINKVAGQPGMVTISNNMGNQFPQPFLPNPNLYQNSILTGYPMGPHVGNPGYPMAPGGSIGYSGMYNGCGAPLPWSGGMDPCTGAPQESVIVVDTNSGTSARSSQPLYKTTNDMTSEEKIQAAVRGEIDVSLLNQTQKRKYKKCLKVLKEEEEESSNLQQKEEKNMVYSSANNQNSKNSKNSQKKNPKGSSQKNQSERRSQSYKNPDDMSSEEKIQAAVRGEIDLAILNQTQKKKYKKCLKAIKEEELNAIQKQREEDELMDKVYEIAKGRVAKPQGGNNQSANQNSKKSNKGKEKSVSSNNNSNNLGNTSNAKHAHQISNKKQKQGQTAVNTSSSNANVTNRTKNNANTTTKNNANTTTKNNANTTTKKGNDKSSSEADSKTQEPKQNQQSYQKQQKNQQKQLSSKQHPQSNNSQDQNKHAVQNQQHTQSKKNSKGSQHTQIQTHEQTQNQKQNKKKHNTQQAQGSHQQHHQFANHNQMHSQDSHNLQDQQKGAQKVSNTSSNSSRMQSNFKGNIKPNDPSLNYSPQLSYDVNSYGPSVGYANNDYGHEARYAQYLAANASTLASVEYETNGLNSQRSVDPEENNRTKGKKRGKRGHLEDLTTIDSVFTPKELATGELDDETDREVEAFKRFCLYSVPRNTGQKPKVNFNVKDIMIKKKH